MLQRLVCSNYYDSSFQTDKNDELDSSSDTGALSTGSSSSIYNDDKKKNHTKNRKRMN